MTTRTLDPAHKPAHKPAQNDERLSATFAALANTTRREILARLSNGPASVNELAEPFDMKLPAISKHLKVLERAGLISRGRHAQYRPCALDAAPLADVADWTEQYRHVWEARLDRLDDYLARLQLAQLQLARGRTQPDPGTTESDPTRTQQQASTTEGRART